MTDIRKQFLKYFEENKHTMFPSSSLVPTGDSTLLFTNAGMNQFKDIFLGKEKPKSPRATTSQKCMRAGGKHNDLENVGYTRRHHTFFEMLGNFSFGDYFKKEAIEFAWKFLTKELALPENRLYVTIFQSDDEAHSIWTKHIGLSPSKIFRFGEKDNFWAMGDTGPCGPCSEIYYDFDSKSSPPNAKQISEDGDRFMEIWNLVFMEFLQNADGTREKLPKPSIDTGMGLERITTVIEGVQNNYDTRLFKPILEHISKHSSEDYWKTKNDQIKISQRVVADHIRAITFLIGDGVIPSKDGRGYVLRRIMRRAMRHGRKINFPLHGLSELSNVVIEHYSSAYPELSKHKLAIHEQIYEEEEKFSKTVDRGLSLLMEQIDKTKQSKHSSLDGETAFHLYDTYGFPVDLTADVLREQGLTLDQAGFDQAFENHREKARGSWKGSKGKELVNLITKWSGKKIETKFLGYEQLQHDGKILALIQHGKEISEAKKDETVEILADQTPFYGESGGQVGDIGTISGQIFSLDVLDTVKATPTLIIHRCVVTEGTVKTDDHATFVVDEKARKNTAKNHTATHMLHATLREILGTHVEQKGSLVAPERLRFDFTHSSAVTEDQLSKIEEIMNDRIWKNSSAKIETLSYDKAISTGAMALFGEKYGDEVRVLSISDYSKELCGGTHLEKTGDIGMFKIIKENSVSAGVRRIEALTSQRALRYVSQMQHYVSALSTQLGVPTEKVQERVEKILETQKVLKKNKLAPAVSIGMSEKSIQKIGQVRVYAQTIEVNDPKELRDVSDQLMNKLKDGIVILATTSNEKAFLVVKVSKSLLSRVKANELIKEAALIIQGSGGGREDFAQAGGSDATKLNAAIDRMKSILETI